MHKSKEYIIYTDGGYKRDLRLGGYGAVILDGALQEQKIIKGSIFISNDLENSPRMEIIAVIESLKAIQESSIITIYSDSTMVVDAINGKLVAWKESEWKKICGGKKKRRRKLEHADLFKILYGLIMYHDVIAYWVKAHDKDPLNKQADKLVRDAIKDRISTEIRRKH